MPKVSQQRSELEGVVKAKGDAKRSLSELKWFVIITNASGPGVVLRVVHEKVHRSLASGGLPRLCRKT